MSIEPEDLLEDALRSDLPTAETEARLRRRLLGAGIAVGNGIAATTAAAAGSAGAAAKVATLSWGLKVGLAAAVAIPSVGLVWEHSQRAPAPSRATTTVAQVAPAPSQAEPPTPRAPLAAEPPVPEEPVVRPAPRRAEPSPLADAKPILATPSQSAFAASEPDASPGSTLSEETQLLDRAFAELRAGNPSAAAKLVAEHEARYPQGLLVKERERARSRVNAQFSELSRGE